MKKFYAFFIYFMLISLVLRGQQLEIGFKAGLSLVDVTIVNGFEEVPTLDREEPLIRPSYHLGAFGNINLSEKLYLQAELLYSNKGFKADYDYYNYNIHLHYIALPLLLNYRITKNFHVEVGGEIGYRLASYRKFTYVNVSGIYDKKLDFGIDAGVKYSINKRLHVGIRYNYGISNLFKEPQWIITKSGLKMQNIKWQNRVLQFSVGYAIGKYFLE